MSAAERRYDVVVIGAGPAGYVAAIRCAQLGMKVACVDAWVNEAGRSTLGGTCLNVGCIPSKALLDSSHLYSELRNHGAEHGIRCADASIEVAAMQKRKTKIVDTLTRGIEGLFKKNHIERFRGHGRLVAGKDAQKVRVEDAEELTADYVIIATGSRSLELAAAPFDGEHIVDSTGALAFRETPRRLGIIGAGVIGLELGSVWRRLGSEVVLIEALDKFLPAVDSELSKEALKLFAKQGLDIRLGCRLTAASRDANAVHVRYDGPKGAGEMEVDRLIVAVGRRPNGDSVVGEGTQLEIDERGFIAVDALCRTSLPKVYAIGDVVRGPMLAHKGSEEGIAVAEHIAGGPGGIEYGLIPSVIYTAPEIAWVGASEDILKAQGIPYKTGAFPFAASARAKALGETGGRVKVLADAASDRVLGVHILGPQASELIAEAVAIMAFEGTAEDIVRIPHAHPSLAEAMHEAALGVDGRMLNL
jgi:dihydrolipoamide dehydrogenase